MENHLLGYYCDIVTPLRKEGAEYYLDDLMLDLWIGPDGTLKEFDWDEFEQAYQQGQISPAQHQIAITTFDWIKEKAIAGSFPGDRLFAHACWSIANLDHFVCDDGLIILCTPVPGGLAHYTYAKDYMPPTSEAIRRLYEDVFYGKQALWHACLWMPIIEVMARKEVIVVTEPERLPDFEIVKMKAVTSLQKAFEMAQKKLGPDMRVGHFPYGKWVLPKDLNIKSD